MRVWWHFLGNRGGTSLVRALPLRKLPARVCSPYDIIFGVSRGTVMWRGDIARRTSSPGVSRGFCPDCGTQMLYEYDGWPDETHLYAATLDDPSLFTPEAHYHYAERVPWLTIADKLTKHPGSADAAEPSKQN